MRSDKAVNLLIRTRATRRWLRRSEEVQYDGTISSRSLRPTGRCGNTEDEENPTHDPVNKIRDDSADPRRSFDDQKKSILHSDRLSTRYEKEGRMPA